MSELNLPDRIRALSLDTGETDEHRLADKLIAAMAAEERTAALKVCLPDYVRGTLTRRWPVPEVESPTPGKGRHRGQLVKEAYYAELQRVWTTDDGEKRFADFTAADCAFVAADRRIQAGNLMKAAEQQDRAAEMLAKHHKARVGELPKTALAYVFGGAA